MKRKIGGLILMLLAGCGIMLCNINVCAAENYISYSNEISHPVTNAYSAMLESWNRDILNEGTEKKESATAEIAGMDTEIFKAYIAENLPDAKTTNRPAYEKNLARMGQLYQVNGGRADYAEKIIYALLATAQRYESVKNSGMEYQNRVPAYLLIAYDSVYYCDIDEVGKRYGIDDARIYIEKYFKNITKTTYEDMAGYYVNNLGGYALKHMFGAAAVLNDPEIIRWGVLVTDSIFDKRSWYADGMWHEGTVAYSNQLSGNTAEALKILNTFRDPPGYSSDWLDISFDGDNRDFVNSRWTKRNLISSVNSKFVYPNGVGINVNDSGGSVNSNPNRQIKEEYLKNIELNSFGFYSLTHGTTEDAQMATMFFAPLTSPGAGHTHVNNLSMTLWGGGMEMLPDSGYPYGGRRFFYMSHLTHNNPYIVKKGAKYSQYLPTNPSVIAYDDGSENGKKIQLIEAKMDMPYEDCNIRRLLMTVETDETHSYTFDLERLEGGDIHENFLRSSEDELCDMENSLPIEKRSDDLKQYLCDNGDELGTVATNNFGVVFSDVQVSNTSADYDFRWTGQTSGSSVHTFIKGNDKTLTAFSKIPSMRMSETNNKTDRSALTEHLYSERRVEPGEITRFGALYEATRADENEKVVNVKWCNFDDSQTAQGCVIEGDDFTDIIYCSDDRTPRTVCGVTFCGSIGFVRKSNENGRIVASYLYGGGEIYHNARLLIKGEENFSSEVTELRNGSGEYNHITVKDKLPDGMGNKRITLSLGDGSAVCYKVNSAMGNELEVEGDIGYHMTENGTEFDYFPTCYSDKNGNYDTFDVSLKLDDKPKRTAPGGIVMTVHNSAYNSHIIAWDTEFNESGGNITAECFVPENYTEPFTAILAVFNDNKIYALKCLAVTDRPSDGMISLSAATEKGCTAKLLLWKNLNNMIPVAETACRLE